MVKIADAWDAKSAMDTAEALLENGTELFDTDLTLAFARFLVQFLF